MRRVYLDHAATSPMMAAAVDAFVEAANFLGNPSSFHSFGREVAYKIYQNKQFLKEFVGANDTEIIITSSATEANNLLDPPMRFASVIEHPSLRSENVLPLNADGSLAWETIENILRYNSEIWVSISLINNETGIIYPIKELATLIHKHNGFLHVDVTQALAKIPIHFQEMAIDIMTMGAHKMGGPIGVGCLIAKKKFLNNPIISKWRGGKNQQGLRPSTESLPLLGAWRAALEQPINWSEKIAWTRDLETKILTRYPDFYLWGKNQERGPISTFAWNGWLEQKQFLIKMDLAGIALSGGSACLSTNISQNSALKSLNPNYANSFRCSLGWNTTTEDCQSLSF